MNCLMQEIQNEIGFMFPVDTQYNKQEEGLSLTYKNGKYTVGYASTADIARAALLAKRNGVDAEYSIGEKLGFDDLCLMVDCSRNAVYNLATVKKMIRNIAMLGYTSMMLYTEDTYQVRDEPVFGYLRGGYTIAEMKEIDAYARSFGIEMIPCIQTLAHLNGLNRYYVEYNSIIDCEDIILVDDERTYTLIDHMFQTLSECFSSKRIHIGMDEAHMVGRGKYLDKYGYRPSFDILVGHLQKVSELLKKYDYQGIMWSDMFWNIALQTKECVDENGDVHIPQSILEKLPSNIQVCHWEYGADRSKEFEAKFRMHRDFKTPVWWAGSAHKCLGYVPSLRYSNRGVDLGIKTSKKYNIRSVIYTTWADDGGESALFSVLPNIAYMGNKARGKNKEETKKDFYALTGYTFDAFMSLDYPDSCCGKEVYDNASPSKLALYNDLFSGQMDFLVENDYVKYFKKARTCIRRNAKGQYDYIFHMVADLCDVLIIKYDMGVRLRTAYQAGDKVMLSKIVKEMGVLQKKLCKFLKSVRKQWMTTNKPYGFEVLEFRLGGLIERVGSCQDRLRKYIDGETTDIPELAEKLLGEVLLGRQPSGRFSYNSFLLTASANSFGKW